MEPPVMVVAKAYEASVIESPSGKALAASEITIEGAAAWARKATKIARAAGARVAAHTAVAAAAGCAHSTSTAATITAPAAASATASAAMTAVAAFSYQSERAIRICRRLLT